MKYLAGAVKLLLTLLIVPPICVLSIFSASTLGVCGRFSARLIMLKKRGDAEARDLGNRLMEGLSLLEIFVD
jgi:hypothetical protein